MTKIMIENHLRFTKVIKKVEKNSYMISTYLHDFDIDRKSVIFNSLFENGILYIS